MADAKVDSASKSYQELAKHWQLPDDLLGGTMQMRRRSREGASYGDTGGGHYLAPHEHESAGAYESRLSQSYLFPGYEEALGGLAGRPFQKATTLGPDSSEALHEWAEDVDLAGRDLTQFAHDLLRLGIHRGLAHILPEFPRTDTEDRTLADDQAEGIRPFLVLIDPIDVIGWRTARVGGRERVMQLRVRESETVPDGLFGETTLERIRVYNQTPDGVVWSLWQKAEGAEYLMIDSGPYSLPTIALHTFYVKRTRMLEGMPALERLAELNLLHWQSQSDHRGLFRFARAGILFGSGLTAEEIGGQATIGNRLWRASDPNARLSWVEHQGQAIGASKADLDDLKADMAALSLRPLMARKSGDVKATAIAVDTAESNASLLTWVRRAEQTIGKALESAARFSGIRDAVAQVDICDDVGLDPGEQADIETLVKVRGMREITSATFLSELRRRGLFSDAFDPETEQAALEAEEPMATRADAEGEDGEEEPEAA